MADEVAENEAPEVKTKEEISPKARALEQIKVVDAVLDFLGNTIGEPLGNLELRASERHRNLGLVKTTPEEDLQILLEKLSNMKNNLTIAVNKRLRNGEPLDEVAEYGKPLADLKKDYSQDN